MFSVAKTASAQIVITGFCDGIRVGWHIDYDHIYLEYPYRLKLEQENSYKLCLAEAVADTTVFAYDREVCGKAAEFCKGDIAFLLLLRLGEIDLVQCLGLHLYVRECGRPFGLLDYLHENRKKVADSVKRCLLDEY